MSNNIVSLRGDIPENSGVVNDDLIAELEGYLNDARKGDIVAMAFVGVRGNRHVFTSWEGADLGYTYELSHGMNVLEYRLMRANAPDEG